MTQPRALSDKLIQCTDRLIHVAIDAMDAARADWEGDADSQYTLLVPGNHIRNVQNAMHDWTMASCETEACDRWDQPQPSAAQNVYNVVEQVFDLPSDFLVESPDARIPVSVMGSHLEEVKQAQTAWAAAWHPPRRSFRSI